MVQYCTSSDHIGVEDIQDALEDIMDDEFDTICEDESPKGKCLQNTLEIHKNPKRFLILNPFNGIFKSENKKFLAF